MYFLLVSSSFHHRLDLESPPIVVLLDHCSSGFLLVIPANESVQQEQRFHHRKSPFITRLSQLNTLLPRFGTSRALRFAPLSFHALSTYLMMKEPHW